MNRLICYDYVRDSVFVYLWHCCRPFPVFLTVTFADAGMRCKLVKRGRISLDVKLKGVCPSNTIHADKSDPGLHIVTVQILAMAEKSASSVVGGVGLKEQLSKFPAQVLDVPCADAHLVQLTELFSEWQTHLSTGLQLTAVEVEDIERAWPRDPAMQRVKMFRKWKNKLSSQATYR